MLTFSELGRYGRLGNQMFQIASTIGIATRNGYHVGFPYWKNYDHLERFGSSEDIDIQSYFKNPLPLMDDEPRGNAFIQWGYQPHLSLPDGTNLQGHMQSEKYFAHVDDLIRHYFEFKNPIEPLPEGAIVLHVRRGDYDDNYHPTMKYDYYTEALSIMPYDSDVYVFSDSIGDCQKMFDPLCLYHKLIYVSGNHYITDLQLMTTGTHFILSNSTLCWWGWWLSKQNGKVIAPRNWFGAVAGITADDIYTDKMIII